MWASDQFEFGFSPASAWSRTDGTSYLKQSNSALKQSKCNLGLFWNSIENYFITRNDYLIVRHFDNQRRHRCGKVGNSSGYRVSTPTLRAICMQIFILYEQLKISTVEVQFLSILRRARELELKEVISFPLMLMNGGKSVIWIIILKALPVNYVNRLWSWVRT